MKHKPNVIAVQYIYIIYIFTSTTIITFAVWEKMIAPYLICVSRPQISEG